MAFPPEAHLLAINAGSSSIKFALFGRAAAGPAVLRGEISAIGGARSRFAVRGNAVDSFERIFPIPEHITAANVLIEWLAGRLPPSTLAAITHRVVYGGPGCAGTQAIDADLLGTLYASASGEPGHLPQEIHLIEQLRRHYPGASHVACSDSGFHTTMPPEASTLPIPRRYLERGLKRYGFHGLSCQWLMRELARTAGDASAAGKVVIAHLGGGSSVTAVEHGRSRDTTMGLTPAGGMMMGKRSGDLDPGLCWHLARSEQLSQARFHHMVNHQSGLLGVSGTSADLRVLLAAEASDSAAAEAVTMFCYQARKAICAMAGAMDGIDTLIFSGGIGEHAADIRRRVVERLAHLGVVLDSDANQAHAAVISAPASRVCVRVMGSDEEWIMAEQTRQLLADAAAWGTSEGERRHD